MSSTGTRVWVEEEVIRRVKLKNREAGTSELPRMH